jgi:hypothetical protein
MHDASLRDLNWRFLDLLSNSVWGERRQCGAALKLAALPRAQRQAAADCPYALFDVRFEDDEFWAARLPVAPLLRIADESGHYREAVEFLRTALFYAWHVSGTADRSAQLKLGMSERTATAFARTTLNLLPTLALTEAENLTPRWHDCHAYWNALAGAAARDDAAALRKVQLYGLQLAAGARLPKL